MNPKTLQLLLIAAALFYLVLPYDLVPDFFGLPGRIDDFLMMAWLAWLYQTRSDNWLGRGSQSSTGSANSGHGRGHAGARGGSGRGRSSATARRPGGDPYSVLGVSAGASEEEIRSAYRERMKEYHPDKVAHLGEELQALALQKTQEIQNAYKQLSK